MDVWVIFDYSTNAYVFDRSGTYTIRAVARSFGSYTGQFPPATVLESNTIKVTVQLAEVSGGALVWRVPHWAALLTMGDDPSGHLSRYRPDYYGDDKWAKYAAYARALDEGLLDAERVRLLSFVLEGNPPDQLKDVALLLLAELLLKGKKYGEAKSVLEQIVALPTASLPSKATARERLDMLGLLLKAEPRE
jgi:hypothetical protein